MDGRPNRRNIAVFSNSSSRVWTGSGSCNFLDLEKDWTVFLKLGFLRPSVCLNMVNMESYCLEKLSTLENAF